MDTNGVEGGHGGSPLRGTDVGRMSRAAVSAQTIIVLSCLVAVPFLFIPEALDGYVLPKWFGVKLASLLLAVLMLSRRGSRTARLLAAPIDLPVLLLLVAYSIAWTRSLGVWTGYDRLAQLVALWVIYRTLASENLASQRKKVYAIALAAPLSLALTAIILTSLGRGEESAWLKASFLGHGNYAGQWAVLIIPISAAFFLTARSLMPQILAACALALSAGYFLISNCRGAWLALFLASGIVLIVRRSILRDLSRRRLAIIAVIAVISVLAAWQAGSLKQRLVSSFGAADTGARFRLLAWDSILTMIDREPLWGIGAGNFAAFYPRYRHGEEQSLFPQRRFVESPHSSYLLAAAEAGPLGLTAILAFAITALRLALAPRRGESLSGQVFRTATGIGLVATLIHTGVSFNLESPVSAVYFWAFAGMLSNPEKAAGTVPGLPCPKRPMRNGLAVLAVVLLSAAVFTDAKRVMASVHAPAGSEFKRRHNLARAEEEFKAAIQLWPESPNVCHLQARVMLEKGDLEACESLNRQALALWPFFGDALLDIGVVKWRQNELGEARKYIERSIEIDPEFTRGRIALGNLLASQQDYDAAIEQYWHAMKHKSSSAKARYYIAAARAAQGRLQEALSAMEDILTFKHMLLDWRLTMSVQAQYLIDTLGLGDKTFRVVVRDGDLWPVWQSNTLGIARLSASPPRITILGIPEGIATRVSADGETASMQFSKCPDSRAQIYSIVVDERGTTRSFDLVADPSFHSQALLLACQILSSLGRMEEANAMLHEALRLDPENKEAKELLNKQEESPS